METLQQPHIALIHQAQKGSGEAMEALYRQYNKAMYNTCIRMMGVAADAEDVLQESFITAFKNLYQLKEAGLFGGWLKRIVVNECIRHSKKRPVWDEWNDVSHDKEEENGAHWWDGVAMADIHAGIKQLPDGCRQIFTLYAIESYSHKEIATVIGVSESTSKSQYHRAKQLLKEKLSKHL